MAYRFSLTVRLAVLGVCASVALLVLVFALGFVAGQYSSAGAVRPPAPASTSAAAP